MKPARGRDVWIGGAWVQARSEGSLEILNAATLAPLGVVPECGARDVADAVDAARAAEPGWRAASAALRARTLESVGARLRSRADVIARVLTEESGRPLCESYDEIAAAAACFDAHAESNPAAASPAPVGVIGVIGSFDLPLLRMAGRVAAALAAGGCAVYKPATETPLSSLMMAETYEPLPPGIVNVVTGGHDTAVELIRHDGIDHLTCAGPAVALDRLAAAARAAGRNLECEARGAVPQIVLRDADFDLAVPGAAWLGLRNAGQAFAARAHLYVDHTIVEAFAERLHEYTAFLEVGDPLKKDTDLGPMISHEAARRAEEQVAHALKDGARLKLGGRSFRPWGLPGHFFQPTIVFDGGRAGTAAREEILAPVLTLMPVAGLDEAVARANALNCMGAEIYTGNTGLSAQALASIRIVAAGRTAADRRPAQEAPAHVTAAKAGWYPYAARKLRRA